MKKLLSILLLITLLLTACVDELNTKDPENDPDPKVEEPEIPDNPYTKDGYTFWREGVEIERLEGRTELVTYEKLKDNKYNKDPFKPKSITVNYYGDEITLKYSGKYDRTVYLIDIYDSKVYRSEDNMCFVYDSRGELVRYGSFGTSVVEVDDIESKYFDTSVILSQEECFEKGKEFLKGFSIDITPYTVENVTEDENGYKFELRIMLGDMPSDDSLNFTVRKSGFVSDYNSFRLKTITPMDENPFDMEKAKELINEYIEEWIPRFNPKFEYDEWKWIELKPWIITTIYGGELAISVYSSVRLYNHTTGNEYSFFTTIFYVTMTK